VNRCSRKASKAGLVKGSSGRATIQGLAGQALKWLFRVEATTACAGLALVVSALLADLVARELFGNGLFGAQRFSVYANAIASLLGFAIVVHTGGHLRVALLDQVFPSSWHAVMCRLGDAISAVLCVILAYFAFRFVKSTFVIGDTDAVFQIRIWPLQAVLPYIFFSAALRYACYAAFPALGTREKGFA
jgi:TRAP-type C4-dicarboxylate transport system permease small subunit